jgi:hypothetical protein
MICILSSFCFITNGITALWKQYYVYSYCFFSLFITSIFFHSYPHNIFINIIDKLAIFSINWGGGQMMFRKMLCKICWLHISIILFTFVCCNLFFVYGYFTESYCYHPNKRIGDLYHSLLHILCSIGHHVVIFYPVEKLVYL